MYYYLLLACLRQKPYKTIIQKEFTEVHVYDKFIFSQTKSSNHKSMSQRATSCHKPLYVTKSLFVLKLIGAHMAGYV